MKINKYIDCFKGLIIYLFINILTIYITNWLYPTHKVIVNIINLTTPFFICFILIIIYKNVFKNKFKDFQKNIQKYLSEIFKYWIVGVVLMIIINTIISSITGNIPINEENNRTLFNSLPLYSIISTVFLAPITEELIFRASFKNISNNKYVFAFISAFLFGLLHVVFNGDYIYILPYACLGFFIALSYYETDNILVPMTMHAFHNTFSILLLILGGAL